MTKGELHIPSPSPEEDDRANLAARAPQPGLGSRIAARFAGCGADLDLAPLRGQMPRPAEFDAREGRVTVPIDSALAALRAAADPAKAPEMAAYHKAAAPLPRPRPARPRAPRRGLARRARRPRPGGARPRPLGERRPRGPDRRREAPDPGPHPRARGRWSGPRSCPGSRASTAGRWPTTPARRSSAASSPSPPASTPSPAGPPTRGGSAAPPSSPPCRGAG